MTTKSFRLWKELGFGCSFWLENSHVLNFELFKCGSDPEAVETLWINESGPAAVPVDSIEDASVYAHGNVKWDACMNVHFNSQDLAMLHFCGLGDLQNTGKALERVHNLAKFTIPQADKDMFEAV